MMSMDIERDISKVGESVTGGRVVGGTVGAGVESGSVGLSEGESDGSSEGTSLGESDGAGVGRPSDSGQYSSLAGSRSDCNTQ